MKIGNIELNEENMNVVHGKDIKIKYFDNEIDKVEKISTGDWTDLRAAETITLKAGEFKVIPLGVGMILPRGYEANVVPRSSTYTDFSDISHFLSFIRSVINFPK